MEVLTMILSIAAGLISSLVLFFMQIYFKKKDKKDDAIYKAKAQENYLILKSINAVGKLTIANSKALREGKANGELKTALDEYEVVYKEMYNYLLQQNANK